MITSARIEEDLKPAGLDWITCGRPRSASLPKTAARGKCRCSTIAIWPSSHHPTSLRGSCAATPISLASAGASATDCCGDREIVEGPSGALAFSILVFSGPATVLTKPTLLLDHGLAVLAVGDVLHRYRTIYVGRAIIARAARFAARDCSGSAI